MGVVLEKPSNVLSTSNRLNAISYGRDGLMVWRLAQRLRGMSFGPMPTGC